MYVYYCSIIDVGIKYCTAYIVFSFHKEIQVAAITKSKGQQEAPSHVYACLCLCVRGCMCVCAHVCLSSCVCVWLGAPVRWHLGYATKVSMNWSPPPLLESTTLYVLGCQLIRAGGPRRYWPWISARTLYLVIYIWYQTYYQLQSALLHIMITGAHDLCSMCVCVCVYVCVYVCVCVCACARACVCVCALSHLIKFAAISVLVALREAGKRERVRVRLNKMHASNTPCSTVWTCSCKHTCLHIKNCLDTCASYYYCLARTQRWSLR